MMKNNKHLFKKCLADSRDKNVGVVNKTDKYSTYIFYHYATIIHYMLYRSGIFVCLLHQYTCETAAVA